jgi:hypothetical protein
VAWLRGLGVAWEEIPLLDDRIITRIVDPPRDDYGRAKVRPKAEAEQLEPLAAFVEKWRGQGMAPHAARRLWAQGLRA